MKPVGSMMKPVPAPCGTSSGAPEGGALPEGCVRACTRFSTSTVAGRTFAATPATSGSPPDEVVPELPVDALGFGEATMVPVAVAPTAGAVTTSPCVTTLGAGALTVGAAAAALGVGAAVAAAVEATLGAGAVVAVPLEPPMLHPARARIDSKVRSVVA